MGDLLYSLISKQNTDLKHDSVQIAEKAEAGPKAGKKA